MIKTIDEKVKHVFANKPILNPDIVSIDVDAENGKMRITTSWLRPEDFAMLFVNDTATHGTPENRIGYDESARATYILFRFLKEQQAKSKEAYRNMLKHL